MFKKIAKIGFWSVMGAATIAASYFTGYNLGGAIAEAVFTEE